MTTPGSALLRAVAVMDQLRSPGGCPWDAEQTHASLRPYLVEETYEALEAIDSGDLDHLREELGDVLLQVLFHSRVAAEAPNGFTIDDVAHGLVDKLTRRHPHVFGDVEVEDAAEVTANWETIKAAEKSARTHPLDGIPPMPPLERAAKVADRLQSAGLEDTLRALVDDAANTSATRYGAAIVRLVMQARGEGRDAAAEVAEVLARVGSQVAERYPAT